MKIEKTDSVRSNSGRFYPAKFSGGLLVFAQGLNSVSLSRKNKIIISPADLKTLKKIPRGCGVILTPNHADEMDPRVCFELARKIGRRFVFMANREAFEEMHGFVGWALQKMGCFSVERGGKDLAAKDYAVNVLKKSKEFLVIFPEGEIFYLNDSVQPFHSGAIDIAMKAMLEKEEKDPAYKVYLVPMSIKYRYKDKLEAVFDQRLSKLEEVLGMMCPSAESIESRLFKVLSRALKRKEDELNLCPQDCAQNEELAARIKNLRESLLNEVGEKHKDSYRDQARTLDKAFQLSAHLRERLSQTQSCEHRVEYREDLVKMKELQHLVSLRPEYVEANPSQERLAELLIKLEREVLGVLRPVQLGRREVHVKVGEPVNMKSYLPKYLEDPHALRHELAEDLREKIQSFITG